MKMLADVNEEGLQRIASFLPHGLESVTTLQVLCRYLGQVTPTEERDAVLTARDLAHAITGMRIHLQVLHDVLENIQHVVVEETDEEEGEFAESEEAEATTEPAGMSL